MKLDPDTVPDWWYDHDMHAILAKSLGTIAAGWKYFVYITQIADRRTQ